MQKIKLKDIDEFVYYEKLDNGLEVILYTKDNVYNNYVTFTTKYGSVYNEFVPNLEKNMITVPKGIAHFLEHKVFVQKEEPQPMEFFARSGAICNAYTTFKNTTYLFYATNKLKENINFLLDYVQNLYVTDESVESEKGIISEEIHMYEDRPSDVLFEKIRFNTLVNNPYRDSIIGTCDDINAITKDDLEVCYNTFYHPANMFMIVTGNFDPDEIMNLIKENQSKKNFEKVKEVEVAKIKEPDSVFKKEEIININTDIPKMAYTLKIPLSNIKLSRRKLHLYIYILFTALFDETSIFDEKLKEEKIINNTLYVSLLNVDTHLLISLINETEHYEELIMRIKKRLEKLEISKKDFERKKKVLISNEIFAFESTEDVGDILLDNILFDKKVEENPIEVIESLSYEELQDLIKKIDFKNTTTVIIKRED